MSHALPTVPIISVEDDEDDLYFIGKIINELKIPNPLRFFAKGLEALDYLLTTSEQPFLILCDINMPLMNGLELRQQINQNEFLRHKSIPFVFLTTSSTPERAIRGLYFLLVKGVYRVHEPVHA